MTRSASDREYFVRQCHAVYSRLVTENQYDLRKLFSTFSKLLHQHPQTRFLQQEGTALLAQEFIVFFDNKIRRIREDLD